jgi:hypothetical protein
MMQQQRWKKSPDILRFNKDVLLGKVSKPELSAFDQGILANSIKKARTTAPEFEHFTYSSFHLASRVLRSRYKKFPASKFISRHAFLQNASFQ